MHMSNNHPRSNTFAGKIIYDPSRIGAGVGRRVLGGERAWHGDAQMAKPASHLLAAGGACRVGVARVVHLERGGLRRGLRNRLLLMRQKVTRQNSNQRSASVESVVVWGLRHSDYL